MRHAVSALVVALLVGITMSALPALPAAADGPACHVVTRLDDNGKPQDVTVCDGGGTNGVGGGSGSGGPPADLVTAVSSDPNGNPCTILATPASQQGSDAIAFDSWLSSIPFIGGPLQVIWQSIVSGLPGCPSTVVTPLSVAYSFIREAGAPGAKPFIAPGHAIAGKTAFLETRGDVDQTVRKSTVLGDLVLQFHATGYTVDWGDNSGLDRGPFGSPGLPYPDGEARHVYTNAGFVTVEIRPTWSVKWSVGAAAGDPEPHRRGGTGRELRSPPTPSRPRALTNSFCHLESAPGRAFQVTERIRGGRRRCSGRAATGWRAATTR